MARIEKEDGMKNWRSGLIVLFGLMIGFALGGFQAQAQNTTTYVAKLMPMNSSAAGSKVHGTVRFTVSGNELTIRMKAKGLPPNMMHMVHLHGFVDGKDAVCPAANADANHDGVIDLNETEPSSGTTMIPLNGDPAALQIASDTYPKASKEGRIRYRQTVSLTSLNAKMASTFHGASVDLDKRVVFIHGVAPDAKLPSTAASLPGVPAQVTLPIACGRVVRTK